MIENKEKFLAQDWHTFDQDEEKGWRSLLKDYRTQEDLIEALNKKIPSEIAELIQEYCIANENQIEQHTHALMIFHSGQMYANQGEYDKAIKQFEWVLKVYPQKVGEEYLIATIHFLKGEQSELNKIANSMKTETINYETVQRLQKGFGKTYLEAYSGI